MTLKEAIQLIDQGVISIDDGIPIEIDSPVYKAMQEICRMAEEGKLLIKEERYFGQS